MTADASDPFENPRDLSEEDSFSSETEDEPGIAAAEEAAEANGAGSLVEETGELPADADLLETYEEYDEDGEGEEAEEAEERGPREPSPYDRPGEWFVVHTYAGYENKVKSNLASRVRSMNMEERIFEVVIPMEDVIEFKAGRKTVVPKKVFPGYLLVRLNLDDDSWRVVRDTPGVTGFVGGGAKPTPLSRKEVETFLQVPAEGEEEAPRKPKATVGFQVSQAVLVLTGPFADFPGTIAEINLDQQKVKVLVDIFCRETPVELGFDDISKL